MSDDRVRLIIGLLVIGVFSVVTALYALAPVFADLKAEGYPQYAEHMKSFSTYYSPPMMLILGYYFGSVRTNRVGQKRG